MLTITIPQTECLNQTTMKFVNVPGKVIQLEHSLRSLSKWEQRWHKPFLSTQKNQTEVKDYIRCMCVNDDNLDSIYIQLLKQDDIDQIMQYIENSMTATTFSNIADSGKRGETLTSELIYYYMFTFGIPIKCDQWHLNNLLTLLKIFGVKNSDPKKMSRNDILRRNRALNQARRKKYGTKG